MKVLHLLASNRYSGAENVVCQIINMFAEDAGIEMVYCSPDGQIKDALAEKGIPFLPLEKLSVSQVKKAIKVFKPDVIHAHDVRASMIAALSCGKTKLISHNHGNNIDNGLSIKSILYAWSAKRADHVFWVSKAAYEGYAFREKLAHKCSVLQNVIDIAALKTKCKEDANAYAYDIVYVGRLTTAKNPKRLMQICRLLADKMPDIKIAIAGTGEMETETKAEWNALKLQENVSFLGFVSNPYQLLASSKVMIMTSIFEGTPMVALEAMALGVPIVSTPVGGMCDLIEHGVNGYLCDDNATFAKLVTEICMDDTKHQQLSQNASKRAMEINDITQYRKQIKRAYDQ